MSSRITTEGQRKSPLTSPRGSNSDEREEASPFDTFVDRIGRHDNGQLRRLSACPGECVVSLAVGQRESQQHPVDSPTSNRASPVESRSADSTSNPEATKLGVRTSANSLLMARTNSGSSSMSSILTCLAFMRPCSTSRRNSLSPPLQSHPRSAGKTRANPLPTTRAVAPLRHAAGDFRRPRPNVHRKLLRLFRLPQAAATAGSKPRLPPGPRCFSVFTVGDPTGLSRRSRASILVAYEEGFFRPPRKVLSTE